MLARLRKPGGRLGTLSVSAAMFLLFVGVVGVIWVLVSFAGTHIWAESVSDHLFGLVFFALSLLGFAGFLIMDERPAVGAILAVIGGLAMATVVFWAIVPIVLGLAIAMLAVVRARRLSAGA